jgi:hypothetical protein
MYIKNIVANAINIHAIGYTTFLKLPLDITIFKDHIIIVAAMDS